MEFLQNIDSSKILYYFVISIVIFVVLDSIFKINEKFAEIQVSHNDNLSSDNRISIKDCVYEESESVHNSLPPFRCFEDVKNKKFDRDVTKANPPLSNFEIEKRKNCDQKRLDILKKMLVDKEHKLYKITEKLANFSNFFKEKLNTFTDEEQKDKVRRIMKSQDKFVAGASEILSGCDLSLQSLD